MMCAAQEFKCRPARQGRTIRVSCLNSGTGDAGIDGASRVMQNSSTATNPLGVERPRFGRERRAVQCVDFGM